MNPTIKPISVVLKEARQNKGITLEEAYKATKIHTKILHALEEGTTLGLSHVYVKSYIRIYANYLGISRHELERYFHIPPIIKEKRVKLDVSSIDGRGEKIQGLEGPVILPNYPVAVNFLKKAAIILGVLLIIVIIFRILPKKEATSIKGPVSITTSSASLNKDTKVKQAVTQTAQETFPKIGDKMRLTIFTEEDCWMRIKIDGKIVFTNILKKGTSETWQANDKINLWLANAGIVKLELNGKILQPIGRRGQILKDVVITREGISISK